MRDFELHCYYKQGDDLSYHIKQNQKISDALKSWALHLAEQAKKIEHLSELFRNKNIECIADGHIVSFYSKKNHPILEQAVKEDLLLKNEKHDNLEDCYY